MRHVPAFFLRAVPVLAALAALFAAACTAPGTSEKDEASPDPVSPDPVHVEPLRLADAEIYHATRRVDFGALAARPHLVDGASAGAVGEVDRGSEGPVEGTYVYGVGEATEIAFHVIEPRRLGYVLRGAPPPELAGDQRVTVEINGRRSATFEMSPGFRTYEGHLPPDALRPGRNLLRLQYLATAGPQVLDVTDAEVAEVGALWDLLLFRDPHALAPADGGELAEPRRLDGEHGLVLPPGVELTWRVLAGSGDRLHFDRVATPRRGTELRVRLRRDRPAASPLASMDAGASDSGDSTDESYVFEEIHRVPPGESLGVDLPVGLSGDRPGRAVALEISLAAVPSRRSGGVVRLHGPALQAGSESAPAAGREDRVRATAVPRPPTPPPLVVFLIDTLRADHLGVYGHDRDTSPRLDAFARDGAIVFEQVGAQSSWTRTAVASILTGLDPSRHAVYERADVLTDRALTLPEILRDAGYRTGGWTTNGNAGPTFGFGQGFDEFRLIRAARPDDPVPAARPVAAASQFLEKTPLDQRGDDSVFLYLHLMEPHAPYWPEPGPAEALGVPMPRVPDDPRAVEAVRAMVEERGTPATTPTLLGAGAWLQALNQGRVEATPDLIESLRALYEAEIRTVDRYFGKLVELLRQRGLYDDAWIVVLADHGEEFHDHGAFSHGLTLYEEQLRVPLLVKPPADLDVSGGLRVKSLVRQTDLFPTLLQAAGLDVPEGLDGRSLWPLLAGTGDGNRPSFAQLRLDGRRLRSLRLGDVKLICPDPENDDPQNGDVVLAACSLYDLAEDPGETTDLAARRPVLAAHLARGMEAFLHRGESLAEETLLDEETEEALRALGYH